MMAALDMNPWRYTYAPPLPKFIFTDCFQPLYGFALQSRNLFLERDGGRRDQSHGHASATQANAPSTKEHVSIIAWSKLACKLSSSVGE